MIISRTSRIMSVILVRAHWMVLAGLLTTGFNIVFQMRRKATLMHTRSEQRLAARFFIKLYSSVVKIDRPVIPCGINCTYRLLCFAEGKRGEKVCGLRGICAERLFFLISYTSLFFFFFKRLNAILILCLSIPSFHIFIQFPSSLSRLIFRNQRLRSPFTFFAFSIIRLNLKRFICGM